MRRQCLVVWFLLMSLLAFGQPTAESRAEFTRKLVQAAEARATVHVRYVPAYVRIPYPNGDVAADTGVCTDEIIRVYRALGVDLQREVHEDELRRPTAYPLHGRRADTNIDHRRVPVLRAFFTLNGQPLPITRNAGDYLPGDLVTWDLGGGQTHIGMVVSKTNLLGTHKILHNIGAGPQIEDALFNWKITGHYRYYGPAR